jgi:hypothetical protein
VVGRYDEDGVPGDDRPLDRGEGREVEAAGRGNWIQSAVRPPQWCESRSLCSGTTRPGGNHVQEGIKGRFLSYRFGII